MGPQKREVPESLDDMRIWVAKHEAEIRAWWKEQWRSNRQCESEMSELANRVKKLESKVVWASGWAAGGGALVGVLIAIGIFNKFIGV
jgi:hypothetical protein